MSNPKWAILVSGEEAASWLFSQSSFEGDQLLVKMILWALPQTPNEGGRDGLKKDSRIKLFFPEHEGKIGEKSEGRPRDIVMGVPEIHFLSRKYRQQFPLEEETSTSQWDLLEGKKDLRISLQSSTQLLNLTWLFFDGRRSHYDNKNKWKSPSRGLPVVFQEIPTMNR